MQIRWAGGVVRRALGELSRRLHAARDYVLALGVLLGFARLLEAVLAALFDAGVAGEQSGALEGRA